MKRRFAIISDHASPLADPAASQSVYVAQLAKNLVDLRHEVDVFTRCDAADQQEIVEWFDGARVIHVGAGPNCPVSLEDSLRLVPQFTSATMRFFRQQRYDLVHANFFTSGLVALNLKRMTETPFVITFHELGRAVRIHQTGVDELSDARCEIEDRIARNADFIIAQSEQEQRELMYSYDASPEKIQIVEDAAKQTDTVADIYERICVRHESTNRFSAPYFVTGSLAGFNARPAV